MLDITTFSPSIPIFGLGSPNAQVATILSRLNEQPKLPNSTHCINNYSSFVEVIMDAYIIIFENIQPTIFASYLIPLWNLRLLWLEAFMISEHIKILTI